MWIKNKKKRFRKVRTLPIVLLLIGMNCLWSCNKKQDAKETGISHVVVIGFDGLSPDGIQKADTPNFERLINEGASTMHARAVLPTSSSSNWASMVMGAGPEQHGITSNAWEKDNFTLPAVVQGDEFLFPTIFHLLDSNKDPCEIGAIYHWDGFGRIFEKNAVDFDRNPDTEDETAEVAVRYIQEKKPHFTFIHFDHIDHAGHEYGHGTAEYYKAVEKADRLLSQVVRAIEKSGMKDHTMVIVSADHGGIGTGHGGESLKEIEIPFIVWGANIKRGYKIKSPVYQYDNAATVAYAMGIIPPVAWIGKPVSEVFVGNQDKDEYPFQVWDNAPEFYPASEGYRQAGGLFEDGVAVTMKNPNAQGEIKYTLDGKIPTRDSKTYTDSIRIANNTVIKSAVFSDGKISSLVSEAFVRIKPQGINPPIRYSLYYMGELTFLPVLGNKKPDKKGLVFEIGSEELKDIIRTNTAIRFEAEIQIPKPGLYTFYLRSDDGSQLFLDNTLVVDNDGNHGVREIAGSIKLKAGSHRMETLWFNGGGDGWLDTYIQGPELVKQILPTAMLHLN